MCAFLVKCKSLVEEMCDMGVALVSKDDGYTREQGTLALASIVKKYIPEYVDVDTSSSVFYTEAEAAYIMWHVFRTIRERRVRFPSPL